MQTIETSFIYNYFRINDNSSLQEIKLNNLTSSECYMNFYENDSLNLIEFNSLVNAHRSISIGSNINLTSVQAPQLFSVGDYEFSEITFSMYNNPILSSVNFSFLIKSL